MWLCSKRTSKHTQLIEQNSCLSCESESRLKAYCKNASDAGKAPRRTEDPNHRNTRSVRVIERKRRLAKMLDPTDRFEERKPTSKVGFRDGGPGRNTGTGKDNLAEPTERKSLITPGFTDDHWQRFTVTKSGRVSRPPIRCE